MPRSSFLVAACALLIWLPVISWQKLLGQELPAVSADEVVGYQQIESIFAQNCIACHNAKKAEGGLSLQSPTAMIAGGESGPAVVAHNMAESLLLVRVLDRENPMPPVDNAVDAQPLSESEVAELRRWIEQGATDNRPAAQGQPLAWQRLPAHVQPIYTMESSEDGTYLAVGRGNTVEVGNQPPAACFQAFRLIDKSLQLDGGSPLDATDLDIVQSLAFSPDSQLLATGGYRTVKLWKRQTAARTVLADLSSGSKVAKISPNGQRLVRAVGQHGFELVDINSGQAHRFLKSHVSAVQCAVWLTDDIVLTVDQGGTLLTTRADTFRSEPIELVEPARQIQQLVRLNQRIFAVCQNGIVCELIDDSGQALHELEHIQKLIAKELPLPGQATHMAASQLPVPTLWVALADQNIVGIEPSTGQVLKQWQVNCEVSELVISPHTGALAVVPAYGPTKLWDRESGQVMGSLDQDYFQLASFRNGQKRVARQKANVDQLAARIPELQKATSAEVAAKTKVQEARDKAAEALAAKQAELITARTNAEADALALAEAQTALAAATARVEELNTALGAKKKAVSEAETKANEAETELAIRDQALATANDGVERATAQVPQAEARLSTEQARLNEFELQLSQLATQSPRVDAALCVFSDDGMLSVVAGKDDTLRLYASTSGKPIANLEKIGGELVALHSLPDRKLLGLTLDGRILAWDLSLPWTLQRTIGSPDSSPFSDRITALDFSPDGTLLAVGSGPPSRFGEIQFIDIASGQVARDLGQVHSDTVLSLRFSPDGRWLASGGADKLCRLFEIESGNMIRVFEGHTHHVLAVAWEDTGRQLASASADNTVKLWNVDTGEPMRTIAGFTKEVTALDYIGQTKQLAVVAADGSVRLYEATDGKQLRAFNGADKALFSVALSADDTTISAGGQTGKVWTWQLDNAEPVASP